MALLINNKYFKLNQDGSYIFYKNKTARNREKQVSSPQVVIEKYQEIIQEFYTLEYLRYHKITGEEKKWVLEYREYCKNLATYNTTGDYPLMKQYIKDVNKTIPAIIATGSFKILCSATSLEEMYDLVKKYKLFGDAEIKDI